MPITRATGSVERLTSFSKTAEGCLFILEDEMRKCTKCNELKRENEFYENKNGKNKGYPRADCKECAKKATALWKKKRRIERKNAEKYDYVEMKRDGKGRFVKGGTWEKLDRQTPKEMKMMKIFNCIQQRCNNKNNESFKHYGGRGIKLLLSGKDIEYLWDRDKAYILDKPSIDRIDNDGNYELSNCRFIEIAENVSRAKKGNSNRAEPVLQYSLEGKLIGKYPSMRTASKMTGTNDVGISHCCSGKQKTAGGYKWEKQ